MSRTFYFFDDTDLALESGFHRVPGPVEKLGAMTVDGRLWDDEPAASFAGSVVSAPGGGWRMYYSYHEPGGKVFRVALAESADGLTWHRSDLKQNLLRGNATNHFALGGLAADDNVGQPQVVPRPYGGWYMHFWLHDHDRGLVRYLTAGSDDGVEWTVLDPDTPTVFHPADREVGQNGWVAGLTKASPEDQFADERAYSWLAAKRLRSGDATYVYANSDGSGYEMLTVWLLPNEAESGRRVPHDNAPMVVRTVHRRTSADGLVWSDPELIVVPDDHDPFDMQFYYMAAEPVSRSSDWHVGYLGHYRCWDQTMDVEIAFSRDKRHWERPVRGGWIPKGGADEIDHASVYATNRTIPLSDGRRLMLYTGHNSLHNSTLPPGVAGPKRAIMGATLRNNRFLGLKTLARQAGRIRTKPFILTEESIAIDATVEGGIRAALCDAFGKPLDGFGLAESDDMTGDGPFRLTWRGKGCEGYRYDAVSLCLEVADGTVYSVDV
jgi:hypothetical protein